MTQQFRSGSASRASRSPRRTTRKVSLNFSPGTQASAEWLLTVPQSSESHCAATTGVADTFIIWQGILLTRDAESVSVCSTNASMACARLEYSVLLFWSQAITSAALNSGNAEAGRKFLTLSRWGLIFKDSWLDGTSRRCTARSLRKSLRNGPKATPLRGELFSE